MGARERERGGEMRTVEKIAAQKGEKFVKKNLQPGQGIHLNSLWQSAHCSC